MRILSVCTGAGLWDKAWLHYGHEIVPGCELMEHKRQMYATWCQDTPHLCKNLKNLAKRVQGQKYDGVIGGIPCQSRSKLQAMREAKFGDLLHYLLDVLDACEYDWALFENVKPLDIPGFKHVRLDAMHFDVPHQPRPRWFTYTDNLAVPHKLYKGTVDSLMAYPAVAGKLYGPKRASVLQGWPEFADLVFPGDWMQEALADGVPWGLANAWIQAMK